VKGKALFLILICICTISGFSSIIDLLRNGLESDLSYQKLLLEKKSAEAKIKQYNGFYIPYVSLSSGSNGFVFDESGLKTGTFALNANFLHLWGAEVGVSLPYSYTRNEEQTGWAFDSIGLTMSREVFAEEESEKLETEAAVLSASFSCNQRVWEVFKELAQSLFDYRYYQKLYEHYQQRAAIYKEFWAQENDRTTKETYRSQYLSYEQLITETQSLLVDYKKWNAYSGEELDTLYEEILSLVRSHYSTCDTTVYMQRPDIRALSLQVQSAEKTEALWFLPYLPNPELKLNANFDIHTEDISFVQRISWTLSVQVEVPIIDRGERDSEAQNRKKGKELKELEYRQTINSLEDEFEKMLLKQKSLLLKIELTEIEVSQSLEKLQRDERLQKLGYITERELQIAKMDHKEKEMEFDRAQQEQVTSQIEILKEINALLGGI
jgi:outer membrane protein TolC